jgi:DNA primase
VAGVQVSVSFAEALRKSITETILPESDRLIYKNLSVEAQKYLKGPERRLLASTIDAWELGWNWKNRRVMIPIRNADWKLVALSGRAIDPGVRPTYMHSKGFHRDYYLYGEHRIVTKGGRGILVEGFFDVMGLWQKGYPGAVAMMGTWLSDLQVEKIVALFKELVIIPDGDAPGLEAADRILKQLKHKVSVRIVGGIPKDMDPDCLSPEFLSNELGPPVLLDNQTAAK